MILTIFFTKRVCRFLFDEKPEFIENGAGDRARTGTGWNPEGF